MDRQRYYVVADGGFVLFALISICAATLRAQPVVQTIPVTNGMTISQVLSTPQLEREAMRTLTDVSAKGVGYTWSFVEVVAGKDTIRGQHKVFVHASDADTAGKLLDFYKKGEAEKRGYTRNGISKRVYDELLKNRRAEFSILAADAAPIPGTRRSQWVPSEYTGRLFLSKRTTELFPLLLNGQRVNVPAYRVRMSVRNDRRAQWNTDLLILADPSNPLMLYYTRLRNHLRTVRIDQPQVAAAALERRLATECRAEVAGIYFDTNSSELSTESDKTIASIADILSRRSDWRVTIEGHTDSIGTTASNERLSQDRAKAVEQRLVSRHRVASSRIRSAGYGESKPLESNATLEGRARNRRVEITRPCN
jgi:outer membrane protein OmpA-like peptidoglycan-associated protein